MTRYTTEKIARTKVVKLRMTRQATHVGPDHRPTWTVTRPGSYAPGYEHLANETYPVRYASFAFSATDASDWELTGVILELNLPGGGTLLEHPGESTGIPLWLAELAVTAAQTEG
jgi:hypothetical protein